MTHIAAILSRLSNERARLSNAKTPREREYRAVLVAQIERELADEQRFIGAEPAPEMSVDELAEALQELRD